MSKQTLFVVKKLLSKGGGGGSTTAIRSVTTLMPGNGAMPRVTDLLDKWCNEYGKTYASEQENQECMPYPFQRRYAFVVGLNKYDDDNDNYDDDDDDDYKEKYINSGSTQISKFIFDPEILASQQVICCDSVCEWKQLFQRFIETNTLVVVEFGVSWLRPILGEIAEKTPHAIFVKVDVDELSSIMHEYKVHTLPSFVFFKEGQEIDRAVNNKEDLAAKVTLHGGVARTASA
ncbi:thioredoxin [Salvia divinorum]|uniref:Thioredoxin n=1 Tax=Salvia divinorum TaxID=28513 RepID=A0ABD1G284_SALDI